MPVFIDPFRFISQNTFPDGLGSSGDGTPNGSPTKTGTGKFGNCWEFDGVDDYIASISTDLGDTWTICFWFKGKTASQGDGKFELVGKGTSDSNEEVNLGSGGGMLDMEMSQVNRQQATSITDDAAWHFITIVFQKSVASGTHYYVDGVEVGVGGTDAGAATRTRTLRICSTDRSFGSGTFFKGYMDDFSYWTRALNTTEISTLYNSGTGRELLYAPISTAGCKIYYNFEQTSGNLINQAIP